MVLNDFVLFSIPLNQNVLQKLKFISLSCLSNEISTLTKVFHKSVLAGLNYVSIL